MPNSAMKAGRSAAGIAWSSAASIASSARRSRNGSFSPSPAPAGGRTARVHRRSEGGRGEAPGAVDEQEEGLAREELEAAEAARVLRRQLEVDDALPGLEERQA